MIPLLLTYIIPAAYSLLPEAMRSERATALLLAIALQESGVTKRRQTRGSARGWWQFEVAGVHAVLTHRASKAGIAAVVSTLRYSLVATALQKAAEHNDVLACALARYLLWTDPEPLPDRNGADAGWAIYLRTWQPGRPHPEKWAANFSAAWKAVQPNGETI
jgi:hypothetical protein